jgi:hypothetical protein
MDEFVAVKNKKKEKPQHGSISDYSKIHEPMPLRTMSPFALNATWL